MFSYILKYIQSNTQCQEQTTQKTTQKEWFFVCSIHMSNTECLTSLFTASSPLREKEDLEVRQLRGQRMLAIFFKFYSVQKNLRRSSSGMYFDNCLYIVRNVPRLISL